MSPYMPVLLFVCLSICMSVYLPISIALAVCVSTRLYVCLHVCLSGCLSADMYVYSLSTVYTSALSVCLVYLHICILGYICLCLHYLGVMLPIHKDCVQSIFYLNLHSFILNIYLAPLQENNLEALPTPDWPKRAVLR